MVESTRADKVSDWTAKFEFLALPTFTVIFFFFLVFEKKIQSTASRQPWVFRLKKEIFPRRSRKPLNAYPILLCFERRTDERVFFPRSLWPKPQRVSSLGLELWPLWEGGTEPALTTLSQLVISFFWYLLISRCIYWPKERTIAIFSCKKHVPSYVSELFENDCIHHIV